MKEICQQFPSTKEGLQVDKIDIGKLTPSILQLFNEIVENYLKLCNSSSESQPPKTECSSLLLKI